MDNSWPNHYKERKKENIYDENDDEPKIVHAYVRLNKLVVARYNTMHRESNSMFRVSDN
jgi:hypothetical protein